MALEQLRLSARFCGVVAKGSSRMVGVGRAYWKNPAIRLMWLLTLVVFVLVVRWPGPRSFVHFGLTPLSCLLNLGHALARGRVDTIASALEGAASITLLVLLAIEPEWPWLIF